MTRVQTCALPIYKVYVTGGGKESNRRNDTGRLSIYNNNQLINIDPKAVEGVTGQTFRDIVHLTVDPNDSYRFFAFSWGEGIYEFRNNGLHQWHHWENSNIESANGYLNYMRCDGGAFDKYGNMWFLNSNIDNVLKVYKRDGTWIDYHISGLSQVNNIE